MPIYNPVSDADKVDGCDAGVATGDVFKIPAGIAQGDIFYVDASGNIVKLVAGTSGHFLKTQGAGANPIWAAGVGGVTTWLALTDTPGAFDNGKLVKSGAAALGFGMLESDIFKKDGSVAMTGNLDLDGNRLTLDTDGDSYFLEIFDDFIGLWLGNTKIAEFSSSLINFLLPLKINQIGELSTGVGVTIDNCLIKDGEAADSDKVDGEHASAIVTNARVKAHFPDTIANILSNHTKAVHDALNIDADTLDSLNSLDFIKKDGSVAMTGNLDLDGNRLTLDTDGDSFFLEIFDDQIGLWLGNSKKAEFTSSLINFLLPLKINQIGELSTGSGVTVDNCLIKDGKAADSDEVDGCDAGIATGDVFKIPTGISEGDIFYVNAGGNIVKLDTGTSGYFLKTQGAGDPPIWAAGGGVTDHGALTGLGDDDHSQYYNSARHTKAIHDALNIDADTLDSLNSLDFIKKDGSVAMTGNLDLDGNRLTLDTDGDSFFLEIFDDQIGLWLGNSKKAEFTSSLINFLLPLKINQIGELSTGVGVTVDNCLIKDGAPRKAVCAKSGLYYVTSSDEVILGNASGGGFNVVLPTASGRTGKEYIIKKTDSSGNNVIISTYGTQTIDGASSVNLSSQWNFRCVVSDGSNWLVIGKS